jgi:uncharacterized damage-inducible protein DinB
MRLKHIPPANVPSTPSTERIGMNLVSLINDYAAYNLWANKRLVEWLRTKPSETMERQVPSSFPTLKQTVVHIRETERAWLSYLQQIRNEHKWGEEFQGAPEEAFDGLLRQSEEFVGYVQLLTEPSLQERLHLSIPYVGEFDCPRFEMIQHCVNHSTYHRGQIVTMGRNVGLGDPPMTDYMAYFLMGKQAGGLFHRPHQ